MINSWFHNVSSLKRPKHQNNPLYVHPDDARARNLGEGSSVTVKNEFGEIKTVVALDGGEVRFVPVLDDRGEGLAGVEVRAHRHADLEVGGVRFALRPA